MLGNNTKRVELPRWMVWSGSIIGIVIFVGTLLVTAVSTYLDVKSNKVSLMELRKEHKVELKELRDELVSLTKAVQASNLNFGQRMSHLEGQHEK